MKTHQQPMAFTLKNALATMSLLLSAALASPAAAVQCGDTIGPNVTVALSGSITCDNTTGGLTIVGPAKVDLTDFAISCNDTNQDGVVPTGLALLGKQVQVRGGHVFSCQTGVRLAGQGLHRVEDLYVAGRFVGVSYRVESDKNTLRQNQGGYDGIGFWVIGHSNTLRKNTVEYARRYGFYIEGDNTRLERNSASRNRGQNARGFQLIYSTGHKLTANEATDNEADGFHGYGVEQVTLRGNRAFRNGSTGMMISGGKGHRLTGNEARENWGDGILMAGASETTLTNNVAVGNDQVNSLYAFDLNDYSANCGTNTWKNNTFGTASQPCVQ